jgi:hypothetical protein
MSPSSESKNKPRKKQREACGKFCLRHVPPKRRLTFNGLQENYLLPPLLETQLLHALHISLHTELPLHVSFCLACETFPRRGNLITRHSIACWPRRLCIFEQREALHFASTLERDGVLAAGFLEISLCKAMHNYPVKCRKLRSPSPLSE